MLIRLFSFTGKWEGLLKKLIKSNEEGKPLTGQERKPTLSKQEES